MPFPDSITKAFRDVSKEFNYRCSACSIRLLPHKAKYNCDTCHQYFCSACILLISVVSSQSVRRCKCCRVFCKSDLSWADLMQLRVRDLVWFLDRQSISSQGMKEKEQLAELILDYYGSENYHRGRVTRQQQVAEMAEVMKDLSRQERRGTPEVPEYGEGPDEPSTSQRLSRETNVGNNVSIPDCDEGAIATSSPSNTSNPGVKRVTLKEIESESAIEQLSVKQLKDLLAFNFVDYKGCVERHELIARALRLWNDSRPKKNATRRDGSKTRQQQQAAPSGPQEAAEQSEPVKPDMTASPTVADQPSPSLVRTSSPVKVLEARESDEDDPEEEISDCRICMDAPINCVLLECGHMCTCVECGKKLAECPICRQYIVRAVRTFKA